MFNTRILVFVLSLFSLLKANANTISSYCVKQDKCATLNFDSLLNVIDLQIDGDWEPPGKLLRLADFNTIYDNPNRYIESIKKSFANKNLSETKKMICLYSVQQLDLKHYLELSNYCLKLVNDGFLSERIFFLLIFPYEWNTDIRFAENYKLEGVKKFLKAVINNEKLPWRNSIKNVLNGQMLRDRKRMNREGGLL